MLSQKILTNNEVRYLLVAAFGFGCDFIIFLTLVDFLFSIVLSNLLAFFVGFSINLVLIRHYVYKRPKFAFWKDFYLNLAVNGFVIICASVILEFMIYTLHLDVIISKILISAATLSTNLFIRKLLFNT